MTHDEYMWSVERGEYPADPRVPVVRDVVNKNGIITNLALGKFGGVALIRSESNSVRSNHYHKTDWHFLRVLFGRVRYYYRPVGVVGSDGLRPEPSVAQFGIGETFFTPPMVEHAVVSIGYTEVLSVSRMARRHDDHEADLVRVELVSVNERGEVTTLR